MCINYYYYLFRVPEVNQVYQVYQDQMELPAILVWQEKWDPRVTKDLKDTL
jgi:hypothetical protein